MNHRSQSLDAVLEDLQSAYASICTFRPYIHTLAILDNSGEPLISKPSASSSLDGNQTTLPGLAKFKESVKRDVESVVWREVLSAPAPVVAVTQHLCDPRAISTDKPSKGHSKRQLTGTETGVKVDVIADGGRQWIRVNTITATRLGYEFQELDSYLSDSSSDMTEPSGEYQQQSNNEVSLIRMAKSLVAAAHANPLPILKGESLQYPKVTIRFTRLEDYSALSSWASSSTTHCDEALRTKICEALEEVKRLGIEVQFGERQYSFAAIPQIPRSLQSSTPQFRPTASVNLDLSLLIALVSDITHADLPRTTAEAASRFEDPSERGLESHVIEAGSKQQGHPPQSRALMQQLQQEMQEGLLDILRRRLSCHVNRVSRRSGETSTAAVRAEPSLVEAEVAGDLSSSDVEFLTTAEARDRFFDIVWTIGGEKEKRRASALFRDVRSDPGSGVGRSSPETSLTVEESEQMYWQDSRYPRGYLPLVPISVMNSGPVLPEPDSSYTRSGHGALFMAIAKTCRQLLQLEPGAKPKSKISAHTLRSLLFGAERGWTTLTANRASAKVLMSEVRARYWASLQLYGQDNMDAAVWAVNPRSLAEVCCSEATSSAAQT
ncbi:hypothetical protein GLOTRDRAFT_96667 [Gloeophyllum trabeum ATCC 11539]|uniref:DUF1308 domain-containing protein n=1 Tax=Gloeophyllum trabeum (strain ATCC 11539 / FP-39264 / Madison 617) TaxID=670483 RepID=S7PTM7_GLOTA|nr:uncharacterized protein GLOTRDRAFT_96667 [Gloeophyllum trabeum ATCC 11539]EPQ51131.1 hypothetical protein GLOTRDRAFT_96667 [Gloeophyllum trabeum ATCC 11539]